MITAVRRPSLSSPSAPPSSRTMDCPARSAALSECAVAPSSMHAIFSSVRFLARFLSLSLYASQLASDRGSYRLSLACTHAGLFPSSLFHAHAHAVPKGPAFPLIAPATTQCSPSLSESTVATSYTSSDLFSTSSPARNIT